MSKAGLCGAHERMVALDRVRRPKRPRNGARPRRFVKADMSGKGRGPSHKTSALELARFPNHRDHRRAPA